MSREFSNLDYDTSGKITLGGSSNAYTVQTAQAFVGYFQGLWIRAKANHTNSGAATLNVNGIGARSIRDLDGNELAAGAIVDGGIYDFVDDGSQFLLLGSFGGGIPVVGPASSTTGNLPSFADASGNLLQDSGIASSDVAQAPANLTDEQLVVGDGGSKGVKTIPQSTPSPPNDDFNDVDRTGFTMAGNSQANRPADFVMVLTLFRTPNSGGRAAQIAFETGTAVDQIWTRSLSGSGWTSWVRLILNSDIGSTVQAWDTVLDDLAGLSLSQGDVLYYNGSNLVNLGPGTSGQFLQTQGAGANPQWAAAGIFTEEFVSSAQSVTSGGSLTLAHGLSSTPKIIQVLLRFISAVHGYSIGDEAFYQFMQPTVNSNRGYGAAITADSTNIDVRFGDHGDTQAFIIMDKSDGTFTEVEDSDVNIIVKAWA